MEQGEKEQGPHQHPGALELHESEPGNLLAQLRPQQAQRGELVVVRVGSRSSLHGFVGNGGLLKERSQPRPDCG